MRTAGILVLSAFLLGATAQDGPMPIEVARVHTYTEGPVLDDDGNLFVSHDPYVSMITPDGTVTRWTEAPGANGHKILPNGEHLLCAGPAVLRLSPDGDRLGEAASDCGGIPIRRTNDLTLDAHGGFYFTDPGDPEAGALEDAQGKVCYVDADGATHLVADGLAFPNGLVLRPDGETLLVGESMRNRILEFRVTAPGTVSGAATEFAELPAGPEGQLFAPDGMALTEAGDLYVAHYGTGQVRVLDRDGALVRNLPAGNTAASNVAFGGENRDQLFVTGSALGAFDPDDPGVVYRLDLPGVRGVATRN